MWKREEKGGKLSRGEKRTGDERKIRRLEAKGRRNEEIRSEEKKGGEKKRTKQESRADKRSG